ncbi:SURF1 family protein [Rothia sp. P13129]|uniref:SURF1 family cytochrome oxidase biogenesis protein n=1 Tax=unclassified Rothia (in: high G+C Gram-positive bacteria) TaxID=2689056 RepID=UPI003ACBDFF5
MVYRFLFSGKWIAGFIFCVLFSVLCLYLAQWQMGRKEALDYKNSLITNNYHAPAHSLAEVPHIFDDFQVSEQWHPVSLRGEYLSEQTLLVRNRPFEGLNGFEVLVPFRVSDSSTVVLVDRGWIPADLFDAAAENIDIPVAPQGEVSLVVRVHRGELSTGKDSPAGQIPSINLQEAAKHTGLDIAQGAYGILATESPAPAIAPEKLKEPELDVGPNLSYSVQWYVFAAMSYIAFIWLARQKVRNDEIDRQVAAELEQYYRQFYDDQGNYIGEEDEEVVLRKMEMADDMPAHMKSIVRPRIQKKRARPSDEEEEDALLEAYDNQ